MRACGCALNFTMARCPSCPAPEPHEAEFQSIPRPDDRYEPRDAQYARMEAERDANADVHDRYTFSEPEWA